MEINKFKLLSEEEAVDIEKDLENIDLFKGLESKDLHDLIMSSKLLDVKKDDYIFKTGDSFNYMYLIYKGQVKIFYNTIDGKEQIFYLYQDGDFIGGLNILKQTDYLYMGQALTDCNIVAISEESFNKYILTNVEALKVVLSKSFERIRHAEELIQVLSTSNASMKTAGMLLKLAREMGEYENGEIFIELSINREELGSLSGLTRETVTRKLSEFRDLGYIEIIGNKQIRIADLKALEDYVF